MTGSPGRRVCTHRHGTRQRNARRACHPRCSCTPCRAAHARYQRALYLSRQRGESARTPAAPVAAHVAALRAAGMSREAIAAAAGVGLNTVDHARRPGRMMYTCTAELILAVPVPATRPSRFTDPTGTRRRLQALYAIGWPMAGLAADLGLPGQAVQRILNGSKGVTAAIAGAVTELYDERYATDGPSVHTPGRARKAGWKPPHAWASDADLDNPAARPLRLPPPCRAPVRRRTEVDAEVVRRLCAGERVARATRAEREAAVRYLAGPGRCSDAQAAARTGLSQRQVTRIRGELSLPPAVPAGLAAPPPVAAAESRMWARMGGGRAALSRPA